MSKRILGIILTVCMLMSFAGCGEEKIISEDYQIGNSYDMCANAVMKTDTGFYYSQSSFWGLSLHYYDSANGKNMFLCNKPECRHEGDEFCVATSEKYMITGTTLYSNSLYINAIEVKDTTYEYKILKASLDGSSLDEVVTYLTINTVEVCPGEASSMVIHRNKVFLPYKVNNVNNYKIGFSGVAIYDLETEEITYLGEKDGDSEVTKRNFCGCGDYMYFVTAEKYKQRLCRYSYVDGSVEELPLERNFTGYYTIYDEDTIFYKRGSDDILIYKQETGENIGIDTNEWSGIGLGEGGGQMNSGIDDLVSDGKYVYISENGWLSAYSSPDVYVDYLADGSDLDYAEINILDGEGNLVNSFPFSTKEVLGYSEYFLLHFCGDTIYMQTPKMMYECNREDFVAGKPKFKEVYPIDIRLPERLR